MSDTCGDGVLYTEHSALAAMTPIASLWSYETRSRGRDRRRVGISADGGHEYWLDPSDPLLNTILPGTGVSLIVNVGECWAAGRSLASCRHLPRVSVVGPVTRPRILRVGRFVHAIGAAFQPTLTPSVFGVPPSELVDQIVPLQDLWVRDDVEWLFERCAGLETRRGVTAMKDTLMARIARPACAGIAAAARLIRHHRGRVSIDRMARGDGLSRREFARRFRAAAGMPPKLFARITRFQALVNVLLSTDVSRWASVAPDVGFYDQAHMINEFRVFAGSPPTAFFRPHGDTIEPGHVRPSGRPRDWIAA